MIAVGCVDLSSGPRNPARACRRTRWVGCSPRRCVAIPRRLRSCNGRAHTRTYPHLRRACPAGGSSGSPWLLKGKGPGLPAQSEVRSCRSLSHRCPAVVRRRLARESPSRHRSGEIIIASRRPRRHDREVPAIGADRQVTAGEGFGQALGSHRRPGARCGAAGSNDWASSHSGCGHHLSSADG